MQTKKRRAIDRASIRTAAMLMALACYGWMPPSSAEAMDPSATPALNAQVQALSHKLRCLVCQNQSIAESDAPLAQDLRRQVREQLVAGKGEDDILRYMVDRYGDFVLYAPPFKAITLLLWGGPAILFLGGVVGLGMAVRRRRPLPHTGLSEDDHRRATAWLMGHDKLTDKDDAHS
ncbi:MAG TPA: cytochrome c-type biogenesis protein [Candidimonas sp.]|nr:cytochrome c-type biogenesis protein [Candidimonas sp.]